MGLFFEKYDKTVTKSMNFIQRVIKPFRQSSSREGLNEEDLEKIAAQEQKLFKFPILVSATRDFHSSHKLGEGGFGPVYKGKLDDGREIAVKKLSHISKQGNPEFVNEAKLLARVQHRNIVNLLGYCVHGEYKLLVYEYVNRESLDKLLFKSNIRYELDWKRRFEIICGIARGLLYLHEGAPDRIIHRDIKASNILLDDKWVPKIADFGMARLFPEDQTHVNTRVAGTNGYMAPEYVMHGHLSAKADTYSFGVLVLELVSGQKNSTYSLKFDDQSLLDWAYKLYKKGKSLDIMDRSLIGTAEPDQVKMCIKIGLLCTQGEPQLRPSMQRVVVLLAKKTGRLEEPTRPGTPGSRYRRPRSPSSVMSSVGTSNLSRSDPFDSSLEASTTTAAGTGTATASASVNRNRTSSPSVTRNRRFDPHGKRPMRNY